MYQALLQKLHRMLVHRMPPNPEEALSFPFYNCRIRGQESSWGLPSSPREPEAALIWITRVGSSSRCARLPLGWTGRSYFMLLGQEWVTRRGALLQPEEERDSSCSLLRAAQPDLTLPSPCGFSGPWEVPLLPALEATKELQHSKAL